MQFEIALLHPPNSVSIKLVATKDTYMSLVTRINDGLNHIITLITNNQQ